MFAIIKILYKVIKINRNLSNKRTMTLCLLAISSKGVLLRNDFRYMDLKFVASSKGSLKLSAICFNYL